MPTPLPRKWESLSKFCQNGIAGEQIMSFNGHTIQTDKATYTMLYSVVYREEKKTRGKNKHRKSK
jgi:hypothetical protein